MRTFKGTQAVRNPSRKTLHRLIAALALLTAVVVGFSLTVFAYFTDSLVNAGNTIASGRFSADLMVAADENGDTPLYTRAGVLNADAEVILDGYAGQTVYVRVAAGADSTVAFQLRLTAEAGGRTLLAVPGTGDNPVLEPGSQTLTYAVEVPADGRMTLRLDTAFCAAVLTGVPTTTTTTTTVATTTATDPSPADNALTGELSVQLPAETPADTTAPTEDESTTATDSSAATPATGEDTAAGSAEASGGQTTTAADSTGSADGTADSPLPSGVESTELSASAE